MDNIHILKKEISDEVTSNVKNFLKELEPLVIENIADEIEMKYIQQIYAQESEIAELKERVAKLEETILWAIHNMEMDV